MFDREPAKDVGVLKITDKLSVAITLLLVGILFVSALIVERNLIYDDSFITYRYAKNLALGHGITWNPGENPVEGYTNLLLVLITAPFIRMGIDPLLVTRVLSLLAAVGLCVLCYRFARDSYGCDRPSALLVALSFVAATPTALLCMVGLETVMFTFSIFASFYFLQKFLVSSRERYLIASNLMAFVAFLLRPEAILLAIISAGFTIATNLKRPDRIGFVFRTWGWTYVVPMVLYMGWKLLHFGTLLPAAFHIKAGASTGTAISYMGLESVSDLLSDYRVAIALAVLSVAVLPWAKKHVTMAVAGIFLLAYILFYTRVDTLMNIANRFLYPVIPFIWFLAIPAISVLFRSILAWKRMNVLKIIIIPAVFFLMFNANLLENYLQLRDAVGYADYYDDQEALMKKEYTVGKKLSRYEHIDEILIACGDAGTIPYFSGAGHLDTAGLNDNYIARERDLDKLVDYFFSRKPTLVLHPAKKDFTEWIYGDHGPLGNYEYWCDDARWDNYRYVGTITTSDDIYDLHVLLRRDYQDFDGLSSFLNECIIDIHYEVFPLRLGTYLPKGSSRQASSKNQVM